MSTHQYNQFAIHFVLHQYILLMISQAYISSSCLPMCSCTIIVFLGFSRCFLTIFSVILVHVFRKPCLVDLGILALFGLKSAAFKYWASSSFEVCARMLFTTFPDCYVPRGTSHITVFYFWWLWWFLLHSYILKFLAFLVWWCIHHHIRPLMLLMGLYVFLEKCWYTSLACLTW